MNGPDILRVLVVTNMYPRADRPDFGTFVAAQVEALRRQSCEVEVLQILGDHGRWHYLHACWQVLAMTWSRRFDIVHAHYGLTALPALFRWRRPLVVTFHGSDVLVGRVQPALSRLASRWADANIAVSKAIHAVVGGRHIPCGVDLERFCPGPQAEARKALELPPAQRIVLFPFDPARAVKRHALAVAAVERLQAAGMAVSLLPVLGVPNAKMPLYYRAADVMLLTSRSEGSPTSIKEALACNLPVVSVRVGDVPDLLDGVAGGWLCEDSPEDLARALASALAPEARRTCQGRQAMARFGNDTVAAAVRAVYLELLEARRGSPLRRRAFACLRATGLPAALRACRKGGELTILTYHDPKPELLEQHLGYLTRHYEVLALAEVLRRWDAQVPLPPRPLVLTLDDGHKGNAALLPVFERYRVMPTIFLCSGIVGSHRGFWFQHVPTAQRQALKTLAEAERRAALLRFGFDPEAELTDREALSACEIEQARSTVDFQAHTRFHPVLTTCDDAVAAAEISGSRAELWQRFGLQADVLAYPNGDHGPRERALARQAGYRAAVTMDAGFNKAETDRLALKRIAVPDDATVSELAVRSSGLWHGLKAFRRRWPGNSASEPVAPARPGQLARNE